MKEIMNNEIKNLDSFSLEVLTKEELILVKGGKSEDVYIDTDENPPRDPVGVH